MRARRHGLLLPPAQAALLAALFATSQPAPAGQARIETVMAAAEPAGTWRFDVTVRHTVDGWGPALAVTLLRH